MRKALLYDQNSNRAVKIYIDESESAAIEEFITGTNSNIKTYSRFKALVFEGRRNNALYSKKNICKECDNLYAINFTSGRNQNDRLYCLEFHDGIRRIVLARLYEGKKSQKMNKRLQDSIRPVCKWQYTFEDEKF